MKKQRKNNTEKIKNQKISWLAKAVYAAAAILAVAPTANAMHIMEGYLPPVFCIAWGIVCLPFLVFGFRSLNRRVQENRRSITLIAMAGAFAGCLRRSGCTWSFSERIFLSQGFFRISYISCTEKFFLIKTAAQFESVRQFCFLIFFLPLYLPISSVHKIFPSEMRSHQLRSRSVHRRSDFQFLQAVHFL